MGMNRGNTAQYRQRSEPRGAYFTAKESKTTRALAMFALGVPVDDVISRTGLTRKYAEKLKNSLTRRNVEMNFAGEYEMRCQKHSDALIAEGGFETFSERLIGYENGARRMVACLPIIPFGGR